MRCCSVLHNHQSWVLFAVPLLVLGLFAYRAKGDEVTIADIQEQWKQHQEKLKSFSFTWNTTRFDRAGTLTDPLAAAAGKRIPEADKYTEFQRSLLYDRGSIRLTDQGEYYGPLKDGTDDFRDTSITFTWNGSHYNEFYDADNHYPNGNISRSEAACFNDAQFNWILKATCAKAPNRLNLTNYRVASTPSKDGIDHIVLRKKKVSTLDIVELWVQAKPPYLVTKLIAQAGGATVGWTEIGYRVDDASQLTIPQSMKYVFLDPDRKYKNLIESEIVSSSLNPETHPHDFEVSFPVGSLVVDDSVSPRESYILREGGEKRIISDEELLRGATYDQLLNSGAAP